MCILHIPQIMAKIKVSHPGSPIAVFLTENGTLDTVFAGTVKTQRAIKEKSDKLVGVYDNTMPVREIREVLGKVSPASRA